MEPTLQSIPLCSRLTLLVLVLINDCLLGWGVPYYFNENKTIRRGQISVQERLCLIDSYDKLNLSSLSQREAAAKSGVSQSPLPES
jgi:hypothetical protein